MNDKQFYILFSDAISIADRNEFISDQALSAIWGDSEDADVPIDLIGELGRIWDVAHMTIRDIREHTGLSQVKFATRFCIPTRTIEDWESGARKCPDYTRLLLAQAAGVYHRA